MKRSFLFAFIFFFIHFKGNSQKVVRENIRALVEKTDSLYRNKCKAFSKLKKDVAGIPFTEAWEYFKSSSLYYFSVKYSIDSTDYNEEYYFDKEQLIFSAEKELYHFPSSKDSIGWSALYYFYHNTLIDYETLGHGKSEMDDWNPEKEVLARLAGRKKELSGIINNGN